MRFFGRAIAAGALTLHAFFLPTTAQAQGTPVTLAGLAFSGDAASLDQRFPYSRAYEKGLEQAGDRAYARIQANIAATPPRHLTIAPGMIEELKGRDQAIVTSLVVNSETVSVEHFGSLRKLFVLIRAQALFFDFKTMTVVRSYPLSFAYIDVFDREPTKAEVLARVQAVYEGAANKPGIFVRYANVLADATLPSQVPRLLKVSKVSLDPSVMASLPPYLKSEPGMAETWAADIVSEAISTRAGVPLIPYSQGYAVGNVFAMRVSDGTVFTLKLPEPDYTIAVDLTGIKKVKFGSVAAGDSFVYGTYATMKIEQPLMGTAYLHTALKNGETKVVPATQTYVDDFPAYYDSWNGLFTRLATAVATKDMGWVKAAAAAPDIEAQILKTNLLMSQCK
ncbi:hypothetical protein [Variovorax arabinosiphilus]|uniref:hypothetical protein n=1 Tax=Variovorax arabinosiphilus TaxID=3053498 RepID=UPI002577FF9F|nr:hypothetical protein [Variovorax sp. J2R1-6]MDM0232275.1 hypothetical protein [Variovorax sp. J2R1-6]